MNRHRKKTNSLLGSIAGAIISIFGKLRKNHTAKKDFRSSTQKMGVNFPDRLRSILRHKWIKKQK